MKKFLALFLSLMLVFSFGAVASAAGVDDNIVDAGDIFGLASVYFDKAEVQIDDTVTVDVKLKNNAGFTKLVITPECEGLTLVGVQGGSGTSASFANGVVTVLAAPAISGQDVVVAKLQFKGVAEGDIAVALALAAYVGAEEFETVKAISYVTVKAAYTLGDFNGDGLIDVVDLSILKKHVAGLETLANPAMGDMNGDGETEVADLAILKKQVAGIQ